MRIKRLVIAVAVLLAGAWSQGPLAPVRSSDLVNGAELLRDLQVLSADDMEGRQIGTPGGEKARSYVLSRFKASGLQPVGEGFEHGFTITRGTPPVERKGVNVIGRVDGTRRPARFIVVSAHYDHIGVRNGQVFNGADDNASGTAALFAIAKYFSAHRPAASLLVAAFDGEEAGLQGARAFVAKPPVPADTIALNLNFDMIGRDPDDKLYVVGTHLQPHLAPIVARVAAKAPVTLLMGHDNPAQRDVEDWTRQSDHYAFMQAKIPALYFGVEDFGQHHKATDDFETMSHAFYVRAVETLILAIQEFDASLDMVDRGRGSAGGGR